MHQFMQAVVIEGTLYITDSNGNPNVFKLERNEDGLWLNDNWANPDNRWNPENEFVFSLRKCDLFRAQQARFSFADYLSSFSNPTASYQPLLI